MLKAFAGLNENVSKRLPSLVQSTKLLGATQRSKAQENMGGTKRNKTICSKRNRTKMAQLNIPNQSHVQKMIKVHNKTPTHKITLLLVLNFCGSTTLILQEAGGKN